MAHIRNDEAFVTVYDTRTGEKLREKVPRAHLAVFPFLSLTPKAKAVEQPKPVTPATPASNTPERKN